MRFSQRLKATEKKAGVGVGPEIYVRITIYQNKYGGIDSERYCAFVGKPNLAKSYFYLSSTKDETRANFECRVETECLNAFGSLPGDWKTDAA